MKHGGQWPPTNNKADSKINTAEPRLGRNPLGTERQNLHIYYRFSFCIRTEYTRNLISRPSKLSAVLRRGFGRISVSSVVIQTGSLCLRDIKKFKLFRDKSDAPGNIFGWKEKRSGLLLIVNGSFTTS